MDFTVVHLQDGLQTLDFDKCGNQYRVSLYNTETGKHHYKRFDTLDAAEKVYLRLVSCFVRGHYSFEDRTKILEGVAV